MGFGSTPFARAYARRGLASGADSDYQIVSDAGGVDLQWYLTHSSDVAAAGIDPVVRYLEHGWRKGRDPRPDFSTIGYLEANPDVARTAKNPLVHHLRRSAVHRREDAPRLSQDVQCAVIRAGFDREYYLRR